MNLSTGSETPVTFWCGEDRLCGILHWPSVSLDVGLIVVVGGPQYRIGSHRQFVFLARSLCHGGIPVMRFDYRGMGDSEGESRTFDDIDDDIRAAVDTFAARTGLKRFVLWGLCDGATAAGFYAHQDPRISGLILVNPWVRSEASLANTYLKNYYFSRLFDRGLWTKVLKGQFRWRESLRGLFDNVRRSARRSVDGDDPGGDDLHHESAPASVPLSERLRETLDRFPGKVQVILSGSDLTAAEFDTTTRSSKKWRSLLARTDFSIERLAKADHTFSDSASRVAAEEMTLAWLRRV